MFHDTVVWKKNYPMKMCVTISKAHQATDEVYANMALQPVNTYAMEELALRQVLYQYAKEELVAVVEDISSALNVFATVRWHGSLMRQVVEVSLGRDGGTNLIEKLTG